MTRIDGIACVVFDLDGVLIRSNVLKRRAYYEIFVDLSDLPAGRRDDLVSRALSELPYGDRFQVIGRVLQLAQGVSSAADASLVGSYADRYNTLCEAYAIRCDEVPGAAATLRILAPLVSLYTNSATPQEPLERVIAGRGWTPLFREVLGGPRSKIDNLSYSLRREGVSPDQLVFVGDEQRDYGAALSCGCRFIGLRNPQSDFSHTLDVEFDNMHDVARYLLGADSTQP